MAWKTAVLLLWLSYLSSAAEIRGLNPKHKVSYNPERDFTCLDGSATLPFSLVNDDYCDCKDGSDEPGTAACATGHFYCPNKGFRPFEIQSSRVNDGVCDCCDGADEYDSRAQCTDMCAELGRKAETEKQKQQVLQDSGYKLRLDYARRGAQKKQESHVRADALRLELEALGREVEALKQAKESAEGPEKAAKEEHRKLWEEELKRRNETARRAEAQAAFNELDSNSDGHVSVAELQARSELDEDGDGAVGDSEALAYLDQEQAVSFEAFYERAWDVVSDKCQFQVTTPTIVPTQIQHGDKEEDDDGDDDDDDDDDGGKHEEGEVAGDMPAYDDETRALIAAAESARETYQTADNRKRDLERELGDLEKYLSANLGSEHEFSPLHDQCYEYDDREYTYRLCVFNKSTQRPKKGGREVSLGVWGSWSGPPSNPYQAMKYEEGEKCWNGPSRSTLVSLKCGLTEAVLSTSEPSRCEYAMEFSTPAVCEPPAGDAVGQHEEL